MAESNAEWGELNEFSDELAAEWDGYSRLPEAGENPALDALCDRKGIDVASLLRLGAKLADSGVLAFAFPGGIKYRDLVTDRRWSYLGSQWHRLKIVRAEGEAKTCIVAEGETDAARLTILYPSVDVAVLPGGARYFTADYAEQLRAYDMVLVGLDNDEAGEAGAAKITEQLLNAQRFPPPANDWCSSATSECPPLPDELERRPEVEVLVSLNDLFEYELPDVVSYYENALLPIGGSAILHGWAKCFKSFQALDWMAALAQGQPWCCFEPTEEPVRVAVMQFEIPAPYYRQRMQQIRDHAREPDLLAENFLTWTPLQRPQLRAGDKTQENFVLERLVDAGAQVFLLDPIRRAMGTRDMNAENEVRHMLEFFERLNDEGITVITVHHDNKDAARARGGDPIGMSGSGAWSGDFDTIVSVSVPYKQHLNVPKRNLSFTLRNGPAIGDRGMRMEEDGRIVYSTEPITGQEDADDDAEFLDDSPPI